MRKENKTFKRDKRHAILLRFGGRIGAGDVDDLQHDQLGSIAAARSQLVHAGVAASHVLLGVALLEHRAVLTEQYQFDCGSKSGWMYSVNGMTPNVGASNYQVSNGDVIVFYYVCEYEY